MAEPPTNEDINGLSLNEIKRYEDLPWYLLEPKEINPDAKEILEKYSNIASDDVLPHIRRCRDKAFKIYPYPCLGRWGFLDFSIRQSFDYLEIIDRLKKGDKYLDLGCCVGQDIRRIVYDGAPSENTYGSDLQKDFMAIGYDLFLDKDTLKTTFIAGDVFDAESDLKQLDGQIDVVHAASFFHLFDWDEQIQVAKRVVTLMQPKSGSLVVGRQVGNEVSGHHAGRFDSKKRRYRHNGESFKKMWDEVGEATGTRWGVDARLEEEDLSKKHGTEFESIPSGTRWLNFSVRRL